MAEDKPAGRMPVDGPEELARTLEDPLAPMGEWVAQVPPDPVLLDTPDPSRASLGVERALSIHPGRALVSRIPTALTTIGELSLSAWVERPVAYRLSAAFAHRSWLAVLACLVAVYILVNYVLPASLSAPLSTYLVQPLAWLYLSLHAYVCWKYGLEDRPPRNGLLTAMACLIGVTQIALSLIGSLFSGLGDAPYSYRPLTLAGKLVYVGTMLAGLETSRACLVVALGRRRPVLGLALLSLLYTLVSIPVTEFRLLDSPRSGVQFLAQVLLPTLSQNVLACCLALIGGPAAPAAYRGVVHAYTWLSPVHPRPGWMVVVLSGTLFPVLALLAIYRQLASQPSGEEEGSGGCAWAPEGSGTA